MVSMKNCIGSAIGKLMTAALSLALWYPAQAAVAQTVDSATATARILPPQTIDWSLIEGGRISGATAPNSIRASIRLVTEGTPRDRATAGTKDPCTKKCRKILLIEFE